MTTRVGIMVPTVPFASQADRERAMFVMGRLCRTKSKYVKSFAYITPPVTSCDGARRSGAA